MKLFEILAATPKSIRSVINAASAKLQSNLEKFDSGDITKRTFRSRVKKILSQAYDQAYKNGGGVSAVSDEGEDWIKEFQASQFEFLEGFANDIEAGTGTMEFDARMGMYAKAVKTAYWAGSTIESEDGSLFDWILSDGENCEDCLEFADSGPYTRDTLPAYPGDGTSVCKGNCGCSIVRSRR